MTRLISMLTTRKKKRDNFDDTLEEQPIPYNEGALNMITNEGFCPKCGTNLQGEPIPEESQKNYGATHFGRQIAIYDRGTDRTTKWECPDCGHQWERELYTPSQKRSD